MHDLQMRVKRERKDRFARFDGALESSGNEGSSVRLEDVKTPSETDCPSRLRFPTGAAIVVAHTSEPFSFSSSVEEPCAGGFSGGDAMEIAVPDMVGRVSAAVVWSD